MCIYINTCYKREGWWTVAEGVVGSGREEDGSRREVPAVPVHQCLERPREKRVVVFNLF